MEINEITVPQTPVEVVTHIIKLNETTWKNLNLPLNGNYEIPKNATLDQVAEIFKKQRAEIYDLDDKAIADLPNYPWIPETDVHINNLERIRATSLFLDESSFKERVGKTERPVAEIIRFDSDWSNHTYSPVSPTELYRDGDPKIIAIANSENHSKDEQLNAIFESITKQLEEIKQKVGGLKSLIFLVALIPIKKFLMI